MATSIQARIEQFLQTAENMTSLGHAFLYKVGKLLSALGYTMQDGDDWLLGFSVQTAEARLKNACNVTRIPCELIEIAVRTSVGEFLKTKKGMGALQDFDLDAAVKQIKEGDTTVSFAIDEGSLTPEQRLDSLISGMTRLDETQLARFRRLVW